MQREPSFFRELGTELLFPRNFSSPSWKPGPTQLGKPGCSHCTEWASTASLAHGIRCTEYPLCTQQPPCAQESCWPCMMPECWPHTRDPRVSGERDSLCMLIPLGVTAQLHPITRTQATELYSCYHSRGDEVGAQSPSTPLTPSSHLGQGSVQVPAPPVPTVPARLMPSAPFPRHQG